MENHNDRYLWEKEKEESFPAINVSQAFLGLIKFAFFLPFTISLILLFLMCKFLYNQTGIKLPMLIVRKCWSLISLRLCGVHLRVKGHLSSKASIVVCNHISWLDILAIQSVTDVVFVAKSEVKTWPGLGFLAQLADTLFVERKPQKISYHSQEVKKIMSNGDIICFFPEGTSSDGLRVLKFHSGFFQVAFGGVVGDDKTGIFVQPLSLFYLPRGRDESIDFYGWWGSMSLLLHMIKVLCLSSGSVTLKFHDLLSSEDCKDRKDLANKAERIIGNEVEYNIRKHSPNS